MFNGVSRLWWPVSRSNTEPYSIWSLVFDDSTSANQQCLSLDVRKNDLFDELLGILGQDRDASVRVCASGSVVRQIDFVKLSNSAACGYLIINGHLSRTNQANDFSFQ